MALIGVELRWQGLRMGKKIVELEAVRGIAACVVIVARFGGSPGGRERSRTIFRNLVYAAFD